MVFDWSLHRGMLLKSLLPVSHIDAFSQIIANEGVGTLWNGTLPSLVLVFNPAVQFMFYEAMKRRAGQGGRKVCSVLLLFCLHLRVIIITLFCIFYMILAVIVSMVLLIYIMYLFTDFIHGDILHWSYCQSSCNVSNISASDCPGHPKGTYLFHPIPQLIEFDTVVIWTICKNKWP